MSERTEGDGPPEDVPDWFDAGAVEDEAGPDTDGNGRSGDAGAGNWFDDPDHRPIRTGTESADAADSGIPDSDDTTEDEADGTTARGEEKGGRTVGEEAEPTVEEEGGPRTEAESGPPVEETEEDEPTAEDPAQPTTAAGEASDSADGDRSRPGDSEPASAARERTPAPDEGGSADDELDAATAASTLDEGETDATGTDDADETGSSIRRLVAWLRSVFGRLS